MTTLDRGLTIDSAITLENLDGFSALERVENNLIISENSNLSDISGLSSVTWIGCDVTFRNNNRLSDAAIDDFISTVGEQNIGQSPDCFDGKSK